MGQPEGKSDKQKKKKSKKWDKDDNAADMEDAPLCPRCSKRMLWSAADGLSGLSGWTCTNVGTCASTKANSGPTRWFCVDCAVNMCVVCSRKSERMRAFRNLRSRSVLEPTAAEVAVPQPGTPMQNRGRAASVDCDASQLAGAFSGRISLRPINVPPLNLAQINSSAPDPDSPKE